MTAERISTKADLLRDIEKSWTAFNIALDQLTETQFVAAHDAQGWTVKDHLIHLAAWERSVLFLLQGKPRHKGLGVEAAVYLRGDDDEINAVVQKQRKDVLLVEVLAGLRDTHRQLLNLIQSLTDTDLQKPYRHYLPDEPGDGDGPPAIDMIYGNTAHHFSEHLAWIETLARQTP